MPLFRALIREVDDAVGLGVIHVLLTKLVLVHGRVLYRPHRNPIILNDPLIFVTDLVCQLRSIVLFVGETVFLLIEVLWDRLLLKR